MARLAIDALDFVYVLGDAYIDHPSFGAAIIARVLQAKGFSVGFICQPDWHDVQDFRRLGRPRLGFLVSSGNIDSMVNHYTAAKKRRSEDAYRRAARRGSVPTGPPSSTPTAVGRPFPGCRSSSAASRRA